MKPEHALIFISIIFAFAAIVMGGLYIGKSDLADSIPLLNYSTYTFIAAICFLIFAEMIHITKKHVSGA
jgi:membrane-anchored protein YejM (alkaline phosphatase superfamily)